MITILSAFLTGGVIIIFLESQQISIRVYERIHKIADPFLYSLTNCLKFISSINHLYRFDSKSKLSYRDLKELMTTLGHIGGRCITRHANIYLGEYSHTELNSICEDINKIWYYIDNDLDNFHKTVHFEEDKSPDKHLLKYLHQISPQYKDITTLEYDILSNVCGHFYDDIYSPISTELEIYDGWRSEERSFMECSFASIIITILSMFFILIVANRVSIWIHIMLCIICAIVLLLQIYRLFDIESVEKLFIKK